MVKPIKELSIDELRLMVKEAGLPSFRADQLLVWLYGKGVSSYEEMTNLPRTMRDQLETTFPLHFPSIEMKLVSKDGSRKYLLELIDGALVETVGLPSPDGRLTVCCSSQAGCAMGCEFCATGKQGLKRSLVAGEIVDQVMVVQKDFGKPVTNVVVMGQGEPFANYKETLSALKILNHPKALNIGARHITVSTCGIVSGIKRFSQEPEQYTLAVSLHSARQEIRDAIMPGVKNQQIDMLKKALIEYTNLTRRRFSFEYALMKDINDKEDDLDALVDLCRNLLCHVNLIPLNNIEGSPFKPSSGKTLQYWKNRLESKGIPVSVRHSRGSDIDGACGQLAGKAELS